MLGELGIFQVELDQLRQLKTRLDEPFITFDLLIVAPKTVTAVSWNVDWHTVTLDQLRKKFFKEDDGDSLFFEFKRQDKCTCTPENDEELRGFLRALIIANEKSVHVSKLSPAKPFSSYTLSQVWRLYGLSDQFNIQREMKADVTHFPFFKCKRLPLSNNAIIPHLMEGLETDLLITPLSSGKEAGKSSYVRSMLVAALRDFIVESKPKFTLTPQSDIQGRYGQGPVDYAIQGSGEFVGITFVGITEVKKENMEQGIAQNAVQIESALPRRKRKAEVMEKDEATHRTRCFGIVSDAVMWRFLECTRDEMNNPIFKLSSEYQVSYYKEEVRREQDVMEIVEIIKWLLTEVESDQRKRVKAGEPSIS